MRKGFILLLLLLSFMGIASAQAAIYSFVDGTTVTIPGDFIYREGYDSISMSNSQTKIEISVVFARTIQAERLETLPQTLNYYFAATPDIYSIGAEEAILVGNRDAIRFVQTVAGDNPYNIIYIVVPVVGNGSTAIIRLQPNIEEGIFELSEEARALEIIESIHFEDIRGDLTTVLGNTFVFEDGLMIEHTDTWVADATAKTLSSNFATIYLRAFTPAELAALNLKADPIEVLYYELFDPVDSSIVFNPEEIGLINIRGREGVRYNVFDTVDGNALQRVYFVSLIENGTIAALEFEADMGFDILGEDDTQDMIQTLRPEGTLPPVTMMALERVVNLPSASVHFPDYWQARDVEDGVSLDSLDVNMHLQSFSTAESMQYMANLPEALLELTQPIDSSVLLTAENVSQITLENGRTAVELNYIENDGSRSYPRQVMLILLGDASLVLVSVMPQVGVSELSDVNEAEVRAILNTISPR
jgi:hypothetical protein